MNRPNPNEVFPNPNLPRLCFIKNVVKNPRIIIGDYTYYETGTSPWCSLEDTARKIIRLQITSEKMTIDTTNMISPYFN